MIIEIKSHSTVLSISIPHDLIIKIASSKEGREEFLVRIGLLCVLKPDILL